MDPLRVYHKRDRLWTSQDFDNDQLINVGPLPFQWESPGDQALKARRDVAIETLANRLYRNITSVVAVSQC